MYNPLGIEVPNNNKLASEGLAFNNAFVASPSCGPSRAALLTGLFPSRKGSQINHSSTHSNTLKLPTILQQLRYEVISFGKVGHNFNAEKAVSYGFDFFSENQNSLS